MLKCNDLNIPATAGIWLLWQYLTLARTPWPMLKPQQKNEDPGHPLGVGGHNARSSYNMVAARMTPGWQLEYTLKYPDLGLRTPLVNLSVLGCSHKHILDAHGAGCPSWLHLPRWLSEQKVGLYAQNKDWSLGNQGPAF